MKLNLPHLSRIFFLALALPALALAADPATPPPVTITEIMKRPHPELADKEVVVKKIVLQPGVGAPPHVHPGMVTGYIESGTLEFQVKGGPLMTLKAGDTFFEPPGSHHMVGKNPDAKTPTVIIAFVVNPKDAPLSTPLEENGKH